jgi:hypothetical protein
MKTHPERGDFRLTEAAPALWSAQESVRFFSNRVENKGPVGFVWPFFDCGLFPGAWKHGELVARESAFPLRPVFVFSRPAPLRV